MNFSIYMVVDEKYALVSVCQAVNIINKFGMICHIFIEDTSMNFPQNPFQEFTNLYFGKLYVHLNKINAKLSNLPENEKWPRIVYYRMFVPKILHFYDKLLYIDADVHINSNIDFLRDLDLGEHPLAAIHDTGAIGENAPNLPISRIDWIKSMGINRSRYFNSGVMLINTKQWIKFDFETELSLFFLRYGSSAKMWDQDFLNYFFQDSWIELSPKWNFQITLFAFGYIDVFRPAIYHFTDGRKPWHWSEFDWDIRFIKKYKEMALQANISPSEFPRPHYRPDNISYLKLTKIKLRKFLINLGFTIEKSNRKIYSWKTNADSYAKFFNESKAGQHFYDDRHFQFDLSKTPKAVPFFNGRIVVDATQFLEEIAE